MITVSKNPPEGGFYSAGSNPISLRVHSPLHRAWNLRASTPACFAIDFIRSLENGELCLSTVTTCFDVSVLRIHCSWAVPVLGFITKPRACSARTTSAYFSILQRGKFPTEHMLISYRGFTRFAKQLTRTLFFPEENPECNNPVFNPHRKRCFSIK